MMLHEIAMYPINYQPKHQKILGEVPVIHPSCVIRDCKIGAWTELQANCHLQETVFGDYSYAAGDVSIIYAEIGKFCSIALPAIGLMVMVKPARGCPHRVEPTDGARIASAMFTGHAHVRLTMSG
jgi:hypothetical protein